MDTQRVIFSVYRQVLSTNFSKNTWSKKDSIRCFIL